MNYTELIAKIAADIVPGLPKGITAAKLKDLFEELAQFANETRGDYQGTAAPTTNPGTPTTPVYYFATTSGTYTNFGGLSVTASDGINILSFVPGSGWSKAVVPIDLSGYALSGYSSSSPTLKNVENIGLASQSFTKIGNSSEIDTQITAAISDLEIILDKSLYPSDLKISLSLVRRNVPAGTNEIRFKYLNSSSAWVNLGGFSVFTTSTSGENANGKNYYTFTLDGVHFKMNVDWSKIPLGFNAFLYGADISSSPAFQVSKDRIKNEEELLIYPAINMQSWSKLATASALDLRIMSAFTDFKIFLNKSLFPDPLQVSIGLVRRNVSSLNSFRLKYKNSSNVWVDFFTTFSDAYSNENTNGVNRYDFTISGVRVVCEIDWSKVPLGYSGFLFGGMQTTPGYLLKDDQIINSDTVELDSLLSKENLIGSVTVGVILQDGTESTLSTYWKTVSQIPVEIGSTYIAFEKGAYQPLILRDVAAYNSAGVIQPLLGASQVRKYTVPSGVSFIRLSFTKAQVTGTEFFLSKSKVPVIYESSTTKVIEASPKVSTKLKGKSILAFGDSITAGTSGFQDPWLNIVSAITGISTMYNMAIGGANAAVFSTRNEGLDPYDYTTDHPTNPTDTYGDRHLIPQIDHAPNTLRHKYDLISSIYLQSDGRYIFKPDMVILSIGFNDWKNSGTLNYESYDDVKNLNYSDLVTRANNGSINLVKIFTYLRIAFEKLLSGEVTETRDSMTYGIDCRTSKLYFVTPIQNANPFTYSDTGNVAHTKDLKAFGEFLAPILNDYSVQIIDGYKDSGISWRFENVGASGRYLLDGIHPNIEGYKRLGHLVAGEILKSYN